MRNLIERIKALNSLYLFRQELKEGIAEIVGYYQVKIYLALIITLNLLIWVFAYQLNKKASQDLVILHYNVDFGVDLVGSIHQIYIIPLLGIIILSINFFILLIVNRDKQFLSHLLFITAIICNIFLLASLGLIYIVNFK